MASSRGNPYHDEIGRFTDGPSAGGISAVALRNVKRAHGGISALREMEGAKRTALIRKEVDRLQKGGSSFTEGPSTKQDSSGELTWAERAEKELKYEWGKESWSGVSEKHKTKIIDAKVKEMKGLQKAATAGPSGSVGSGNLLTGEQRVAVDEYAGQAFRQINSHLRGGDKISDKHKAYIAHIDEAIANNVIGKQDLHGRAIAAGKKGATLYRGTKASVFGLDIEDIKPGRVLSNHGFVSTSKQKSTALDFFEGQGTTKMGKAKNRFVMEITTGPRSRGVQVRGKGLDSAEGEVILGRKSKFRVDRVVTKFDDWSGERRTTVHVTHIDPH